MIRRHDQDQPVAADAPVPITDLPREGCRIVHLMHEAIDVDVVVAEAVHLGERQRAHGRRIVPMSMTTLPRRYTSTLSVALSMKQSTMPFTPVASA